MTSEQLLPTSFIHHPPSRETMAAHLRKLRRTYGGRVAQICRREAIWTGCYPPLAWGFDEEGLMRRQIRHEAWLRRVSRQG